MAVLTAFNCHGIVAATPLSTCISVRTTSGQVESTSGQHCRPKQHMIVVQSPQDRASTSKSTMGSTCGMCRISSSTSNHDSHLAVSDSMNESISSASAPVSTFTTRAKPQATRVCFCHGACHACVHAHASVFVRLCMDKSTMLARMPLCHKPALHALVPLHVCVQACTGVHASEGCGGNYGCK